MNWLIVLAAGSGSRIGASVNKIFLKIYDKPLLYWSLKNFQNNPVIDKIVVAAKKEEYTSVQKIIKKYYFSKVIGLSCGGKSRSETVFNALRFIRNQINESDLVGIHNAANLFVNDQEIKNVYEAAKKYDSALLAYLSIDTIKISDDHNFIVDSPSREICWNAQTPQVSCFLNFYQSYKKIINKKINITDDSQALLMNGFKTKIIPCTKSNFKITFPGDLILAKQMLKK